MEYFFLQNKSIYSKTSIKKVRSDGIDKYDIKLFRIH